MEKAERNKGKAQGKEGAGDGMSGLLYFKIWGEHPQVIVSPVLQNGL